MEIAGHNIQKGLVDVNNLWKWPDDYYDPGWLKDPFPVKYWQMMRYSDLGNGGDGATICCSFTLDSISGKYSGGYYASIMLGLQPGPYVIEFNSCWHQNGMMRFIYYIVEDGMAKFGNKKSDPYTFLPGYNMIQFEVINGCQAMMQFCDSLNTPEFVTLTDIKIREGVL